MTARNPVRAVDRRRVLRACAASLAFCAFGAEAAAENPDFAAFLESMWPAAAQAGVSRETFDAAVSGLTPEPAVLAKPKTQAEFTISIPAYLAATVTNGRVARGRAVASESAALLRDISAKSGVPAEMLVAILGVESAYGGGQGSADVLRVLATLAWKGHLAGRLADEFVAALVMLQQGYATRAQLRGSWAGAMGQPQFMPSAYLKYAQRYSGAGAPDIWGSRADALLSIANFMAKSGWTAALPWGVEVVLPQNFDYAAFDLDLAQWRALGLARADGGDLPESGAASLYLPTGARGPAFLITDNFEAIRQYNTSDAYALSVGLLAERIAGREVPLRSWPKVAALSTAEVKEMQQRLTAQGFYRGKIDGKLGRSNRNALHAFQREAGIAPADGFATREMLAALRGR